MEKSRKQTLSPFPKGLLSMNDIRKKFPVYPGKPAFYWKQLLYIKKKLGIPASFIQKYYTRQVKEMKAVGSNKFMYNHIYDMAREYCKKNIKKGNLKVLAEEYGVSLVDNNDRYKTENAVWDEICDHVVGIKFINKIYNSFLEY